MGTADRCIGASLVIAKPVNIPGNCTQRVLKHGGSIEKTISLRKNKSTKVIQFRLLNGPRSEDGCDLI
jgi:hypothetical protein